MWSVALGACCVGVPVLAVATSGIEEGRTSIVCGFGSVVVAKADAAGRAGSVGNGAWRYSKTARWAGEGCEALRRCGNLRIYCMICGCSAQLRKFQQFVFDRTTELPKVSMR